MGQASPSRQLDARALVDHSIGISGVRPTIERDTAVLVWEPMDDRQRLHNERILNQFELQAVPFAEIPVHSDWMQLLIELCGARADDEALDVACGPGLVACSLAPHVARVTGIDLTPKMIAQARKLQSEKGLSNLTWQIGDVLPLPFDDEHFSLVLSRYSFHHFLAPKAVLSEMIRVCRPKGRVMVVDAVLPPENVDAYNTMEVLRDPSHVHALSLTEMTELVSDSGLRDVRTARYKVEMELEATLAASFPNAGDADKIRALFREDLDSAEDRMGVGAHRVGDEIHFAYPILAIVGSKP